MCCRKNYNKNNKLPRQTNLEIKNIPSHSKINLPSNSHSNSNHSSNNKWDKAIYHNVE